MKKIYCFVLAMVFFSSYSLAVRLEGTNNPVQANSGSTGIVERGGIVTSINPGAGLVFVDGVQYSYFSAKVYLPGSNEYQSVSAVLKVGSYIKFKTSGNNIQDIWIIVKR